MFALLKTFENQVKHLDQLCLLKTLPQFL